MLVSKLYLEYVTSNFLSFIPLSHNHYLLANSKAFIAEFVCSAKEEADENVAVFRKL
jgi:hypothetical protein